MSPINISTSSAVFWWQPTAWLRVAGPDAFSFLQGQFTNDLRELTRARAIYGLWLNVKGKVLADSFVLRGADENEFWLGSYFAAATTIRERLESHIIADDVVIDDATATWSAVSAFGFDEAALRASVSEIGFIFNGRRGKEPSLEWVFPVARRDEVRAKLAGARQLHAEEMTRRRMAAAIPAIPSDLGPGDLPNEAGLEVDAISYTKGCYLGQETMARLKSMGQVRRRLLRVRGGAGLMPPVPAPLFVGARQVGDVRSVVRHDDGTWRGLAMLSLMHLPPEGALALAADAAPSVHVIETP